MRVMLVGAVAAVVALGGAGSLRAQEPPLPRAWAFTLGNQQVRFGVLVNTETTTSDSLGARLEAVTPGGPASNAGLKAGDVITRFKGVPLGRAGGVAGEGASPGQRLVELVRALEPGDTVAIEYRRGSELRKTSFIAEAPERGGPIPMEGGEGMARVDLPGGTGDPLFLGPGGALSFCFGDAWCDMELVHLNPDLGEYFGTKDGILVIKAPADSSLPLKSGDVILTIGGRRPTAAAHAMRILSSYEPGETVSIEIMRKQRRTIVTWHVPRSDDHQRRFMRFHDVTPDSGEDHSES